MLFRGEGRIFDWFSNAELFERISGLYSLYKMCLLSLKCGDVI